MGAFDDNRLVGFAQVMRDCERAILVDTAVHPDFQRRGIGRQVVEVVTQEAFRAGCAEVHATYEPHLTGFYESFPNGVRKR